MTLASPLPLLFHSLFSSIHPFCNHHTYLFQSSTYNTQHFQKSTRTEGDTPPILFWLSHGICISFGFRLFRLHTSLSRALRWNIFQIRPRQYFFGWSWLKFEGTERAVKILSSPLLGSAFRRWDSGSGVESGRADPLEISQHVCRVCTVTWSNSARSCDLPLSQRLNGQFNQCDDVEHTY